MKFDDLLVLELIVFFELFVPKGGFNWALQALVDSSESLNINFLEPTI